MFGQKTVIFQRYKDPKVENISFSLLYKDRSLDIVCKDEREFQIWTIGIQYLCANIKQIISQSPKIQQVVTHDPKMEAEYFKESYSSMY